MYKFTFLVLTMVTHLYSSPFTHPGCQSLQERSEEVDIDQILSDDIQSVIDLMFQISSGERGDPENKGLVGLAAPQIGINKRIIIVDTGVSLEERQWGKLEVFINPEITCISKDLKAGREGCYSVDPHVSGVVYRPSYVQVKAYDRNGEKIERAFSGYTARIVQHEIDHLDGIRFPDKVGMHGSLHWVNEDEYLEYRNSWQNWKRACSWETWIKMKNNQEYNAPN